MESKLAYSPEESAQLLGICRTKVFQEIRAGRLKARKAGKRTLLLPEALQDYTHALPEREVDAAKGAEPVAKREKART